MKLCDVCGEREAVGVACSAASAISFAYCEECLRTNREPYGVLAASLLGISSMDEVAVWYHPIVKATLEAEGKTVEELFADVTAMARRLSE